MVEGSVVGDFSLYRCGGGRSVFSSGGGATAPAVEARVSGWVRDAPQHGAALLDAAADVWLEAPEWTPPGASPLVLARLKPAVSLDRSPSSRAPPRAVDARGGAMDASLARVIPILALTGPGPDLANAWSGAPRAWILPRLLAGWTSASSGERARWVVWGSDHDACAMRLDPSGDTLAVSQVRRLPGWGARVTVTGFAALIEDYLAGSVRSELATVPAVRRHLTAVALLLAQRVQERCAAAAGAVELPGELFPALDAAPPAVRHALAGAGLRVAVSLAVGKLGERVDARTLGATELDLFRTGGLEVVVPSEAELVHPRLVALIRTVAPVTELSVTQALGVAERGMGGRHTAQAAVSDVDAWRRLVVGGPEGWAAVAPPPPGPERPRLRMGPGNSASDVVIAGTAVVGNAGVPNATVGVPAPAGRAGASGGSSPTPPDSRSSPSIAPDPAAASADADRDAPPPRPGANLFRAAQNAMSAARTNLFRAVSAVATPDPPLGPPADVTANTVATTTTGTARSEPGAGTAPTASGAGTAPPMSPAPPAPAPVSGVSASTAGTTAGVAPLPTSASDPSRHPVPSHGVGDAASRGPPPLPAARLPPSPAGSLPPWGRFPLTRLPEVRDVAVFLDDRRADPATWTLERGDAVWPASVRFHPGHVPPFDAIVRIDYRPQSDDA